MGVAGGMVILIISLVGLLGALLLTNGKRVGLPLMVLSGILNLPLLFSIPASIVELIVLVILSLKRALLGKILVKIS